MGKGGIGISSSGGLEAHCTRSDVETWSYKNRVVCMATWRHRAIEFRTSGSACRRGSREVSSFRALGVRYWSIDVEIWRYAALEARYRCSEGEVWRYGDPEAWRRDTCRMEL